LPASVGTVGTSSISWNEGMLPSIDQLPCSQRHKLRFNRSNVLRPARFAAALFG
jgi:hypothetical protein